MKIFSTIGKDNDSVRQEINDMLDSLDMITASAVAIMLSETNAKAATPFIKDFVRLDIKPVLYEFLEETYDVTDIRELDIIFSKKYYRRKINKYLRKIVVFVSRGVSDTLPDNMWFVRRMTVSSKQTEAYIDKICETINTFESVKFMPALSGNQEVSGSKRNYRLDHLNDHYKDALIYLVDLLLTCTCITKMIFVEKMIRRITADSEFVRIIENLTNSIADHNQIIKKSRPVYKQFYQSELGYVNGDELLYGMAVTIMVNFIRKTEPINKDIFKLEYTPTNMTELNNNMMRWLDILAKWNYATDVGTVILQRITLLIKEDTNLLLDAFGELLNWEDFYNKRVDFHMRAREREQYLKGNIDREILELSDFNY